MANDVPLDRPENRFLRALPPAALARLQPHLEPVELPRRSILFAPGDPPSLVYFITRGLVSMVKTMSDGRVAEVGVTGTEGAVSLAGLLGVQAAKLDSVVQIPGEALRVKTATLHELAALEPALASLIREYVGVSLAMIAQIAACNRLHGLSERCCRWLLFAHDSVGGDSFPLTHELLALMLGVQRPGVSLAAKALQRDGHIEYRNGRVTVLDRAGLETCACECYGALRARFAALFDAS
jgi:CRP-like cAMP-binding protein